MASRNRVQTAGYLVVITLLGLPLVAPLFRWASSPCTHDGHLHYQRVAAMNHAWQNGLYFSRWMPDLVFGYGYPFLLYREAAPLYLTLWPHLLGLSLPAALNLFYAIALLAAGWFMFLWVRDIFGPIAGIVSAAAYMAAPYLLIDAYVRGNQPESMALAIFPFLLWVGRRFMISGRAVYFIATLFGYLLLALSHNISLLLFTPFLLAYLAFAGWLADHSIKRTVFRLALIFVLGLGISAFYLGPALLELDQITISQSISARNNDFRFNFTILGEILAPVEPSDPDLINPPLLLRLGWLPTALATAGFITGLLSKKRAWRLHVLFMGLAAALLLFMSTGLSKVFWEALPLIEFVQFPWRFIGRAALPIAFLAGVPFATLLDLVRSRYRIERLMHWAGAAVIMLLVLESIPYLYPNQCRSELFPTINEVHRYEHETGLVGVDPLGSYFPKSVLERPTGSPLEVDYLSGEDPQRFDRSSMPAEARIVEARYGPTAAAIIIESEVPFQATYLAFDFPGWLAEIDGEPAAVTASDPEGLITFLLPAGRHTVEIGWQMTASRKIFASISLLSLLAAAGIAIYLYKGHKDVSRAVDEQNSAAVPVPASQGAGANHDYPWWQILGIFALAALVMIGLKFILFDQIETPLRQSAGPPVSMQSDLKTAGLVLAGYNLSDEVVSAGESFDVNLAWRVEETPAAELQSNLSLIGPDGHFWSEKETIRPRTIQEPPPTTTWLPGEWAWDSREIQVYPGTPPGVYDLQLTLFDRWNLQPQTLYNEAGNALGPAAILGQVEIVESKSIPEVAPQYVVNQNVGGLKLAGYNLDREEVTPGDQILLTFFWEKPSDGGQHPELLELALEDSSGEIVRSWQLPPVREDYPPGLWTEGHILRGQHFIRLPADLVTGDYSLLLEDLPLRSLSVQAPVRIFTEPLTDRPVRQEFGDKTTLMGMSIPDGAPIPEKDFTIELVWESLSDMTESYHVFVHLIDQDGQILDQSDGVPAGWTRPTTGWIPGEFIVDQHTLTIPEGIDPEDLSLRIGLYEPASGTRIKAGDKDFLIMPLVDNH